MFGNLQLELLTFPDFSKNENRKIENINTSNYKISRYSKSYRSKITRTRIAVKTFLENRFG